MTRDSAALSDKQLRRARFLLRLGWSPLGLFSAHARTAVLLLGAIDPELSRDVATSIARAVDAYTAARKEQTAAG